MQGVLATSPGTTSSSPGQCFWFLCVCGDLGGPNTVLAPKCAVLGSKPQVSQQPLKRGVAGQGSRAWGQGDPSKVGGAGGMLGAGSLPWEASVELKSRRQVWGLSEHQALLGPGCSGAPPQELCQALFHSALLMQSLHLPCQLPKQAGDSSGPCRGFGQALPQHEPLRITGAASQQDLTALPMQDGGWSQEHSNY